MTTKIKYILIMFLIFSSLSCIEEFRPELDKFENLLVIDGKITNEPGPYIIKLSISSEINIINIKPISNAMVIISEKGGISETLIETNPGEYRTKANGIQGKIGKEYKISFTTSNGKRYESQYEELKNPTNITSIEASVEYKTSDIDNNQIIGYQFYANTETSTYNEDYYLWFLESTYKLETQLPITYVYEGFFRKISNSDSLKTCYVTYKINSIYTASTEGLSSSKITMHPLVFVDGSDDKIRIRYSLYTKQYSISKKAFEFWNSIKKQTSSESSLYTIQPYQIKGNVINIDNEDEPVLGYFLVAGISSQRIFVNNPPNLPPPKECLVLTDIGLILGFSVPDDWPIYLTPINEGLGIGSGTCIDCTVAGGSSLEKPDFWVD